MLFNIEYSAIKMYTCFTIVHKGFRYTILSIQITGRNLVYPQRYLGLFKYPHIFNNHREIDYRIVFRNIINTIIQS